VSRERIPTPRWTTQERRHVEFLSVTAPAHWGRRRTVLDLLDRVRLARPAVRLYELALATKSRAVGKRTRAPDGLPLPPTWLRSQAGPQHADADFFLRSGERHAELIRTLLRDEGTTVESFDALLDFGSGCGRVIRHWSGLQQTRICGVDINPKMVAWCNANLRFADVRVNDTTPPLDYPTSTFDLVYVFSVFTHLTEASQNDWIAECTRVLQPGGYLLFSTLGEQYLSLGRLTESEQESFRKGELVVLYEDSSGTSLCSAYHPPDYVRKTLARDLEPLAFLPAADDGRHDIHLYRKPAASTGA
jgi:SAM-dependent methyltransferase